MIAYKATRNDGTDFFTGKFNYLAALQDGSSLEEPNTTLDDNPCGRGLHVSPTPQMTCKHLDSKHKPYRWFEVEIDEANIVGRDSTKLRVKKIDKVIKELTLTDIFGELNFKAMEEEIASWKSISWFKPRSEVKDEELVSLFKDWHLEISKYAKTSLSTECLIVNSLNIDGYISVADAVDAAAAASAYASADAAAIDIAAAAAAAATATDDVNVSATADAADTAYVVAATAYNVINRNVCYYSRPYWNLRYYAYSKLANKTNCYESVVKMYKLGCVPIGYRNIDGKVVFAIYKPE